MSAWQIAILAYAAGFFSSIVLAAAVIYWSFADGRVAKITQRNSLSEPATGSTIPRG